MATTDKATGFEAGMRELEAITQWFESDSVDLDEGLKKFERGMELAAELQKHLQTIENRVEKIQARFDSPATINPFDQDTSAGNDPFDVAPSSRLD